MTPKQALLATNGDGRIAWVAYLRLWPIVAGLLIFAFYVGGRLESPAEKMERIRLVLAPLDVRLDRIEQDVKDIKRTVGAAEDRRGDLEP